MAWTSADVASVEAAIRARINGSAVASYSIGGRNLKYLDLAELQTLLTEMRADVNAEATKSSLPIHYVVPARSR